MMKFKIFFNSWRVYYCDKYVAECVQWTFVAETAARFCICVSEKYVGDYQPCFTMTVIEAM
jgi:hypothetical protein